MLRISALNDSSNSKDDHINIELTKTKEAKEAEAFVAYNKALSYQHKGNSFYAERLLRNLFDHPLLKDAAYHVTDDTQLQNKNHSGLQLLYSIHKNLASILLQRNQYQEAMAAYIEAVKIDSSEVTVWFQMGQVARKLDNYPLAKICFHQALQCNPNHWPSLDNAITVNYALGDYLLCLQNISFALEKDCSYPKALALRSQIYSEQPSLKDFTGELFLFCNPTVNTAIIDVNESKEYIDEALQIRSRRRQLADEVKEKELNTLIFSKPLTPFSWKNLGEQLIDFYDFVTSSHPPKSLALEVDFRDYFFLDQAAFLRQFEKQSKQLDVMSKNKECNVEHASHKIQQETPIINLGVSDLHTSVISTKGTALHKQIHSILDDENPIIVKNKTDLIVEKEDSFRDLEPMDISGSFELLREDLDIDALNLADNPRSNLKLDYDIAINDLRSLENVLASVIDMELEVQKENNHKQMSDFPANAVEAESTDQVLPFSVLSSTESAVSLKGNDLFEIQLSGQQKYMTDESKKFLPSTSSGHEISSVVNEIDSLQISLTAHNESDMTIQHSSPQTLLLNFPPVSCSKPDTHKSAQQNTFSVNFNINEPAKTNTALQQMSFENSSDNRKTPCLALEFSDGLKSTSGTVIEEKSKLNEIDSQLMSTIHTLSPSRVNVFPSEYAHSPITTSLFSPDISCPKSAFVYHSVLSSIKQKDSLAADKNEYYSPTKSFKRNCSESPDRNEQTLVESLTHVNKSVPSERMLSDTMQNLTHNQLLLENSDEGSQISVEFTAQLSLSTPSTQPIDSHINSLSVSLGQNSVTSASFFLKHESSSLSSHYVQASTFSDDVFKSTSLSLPSHHLNMLTALESEILLKSSKYGNSTTVAEWPNQTSFIPRYHYGKPTHHSHLLLSPSVRSPLIFKGNHLTFGAGGSILNPSTSSRMFSGSALSPCSQLSLDDFTSVFKNNNLLSGMIVPDLHLMHPLLNPSKFLNSSAYHFEGTKTSLNKPFYQETIPTNTTLFKISPEKADPCHQLSPNSLLLCHSENDDLKSNPQLISARLQNLEFQSPALSSYTTAHQDHNYQKKGLLCQVMMESSDSSTLVCSASSQVLASKPLKIPIANEIRTPIRHISKSSGVKRGPKRKIEDSSLLEWTNAYKRRSTRSRGIKNQKEGKTINYKNLMKSYIPSSLMNVIAKLNIENEDVMAIDIDKVDCEQESNLYKLSLKNLNENEEDDVKLFIRNSLKANGIIDLIYKYLLHLASKFDIVWYEGIVDIYLKLYKRLRKHLSVPTLFDDTELLPLDGLKNYAAIILVWTELNLNQAVIKFGLKNVSPSKTANFSNSLLKLLGDFHLDDMAFLASLIGRNDVLGSWIGHFSVRYYWMKAKEQHLLGQTLAAVDCYEIALEFLQDMERECRRKDDGAIVLPNIQDNRISSIEAKRKLEALQRSKSLEDNQKLYDEAHYDFVIENLISTFNKSKFPQSLLDVERPSQLLLLINSLYHSNKHVEGITWAEVSLDEAVMCYKRVPSIQLHQEWAATLVALFYCIDRLLEEDCKILSSLSRDCLYRLADNLTSVIDLSLDVADTVTEMPIPSILPWKIFYRVLHYEEQCYIKTCVKETKENDLFEEEKMSRSLTMLTESHEYLGRHSWCTRDNGLLLLYTMSVLAKDLEDKEREDINFEQCVYCLYGHPTKKGKARHLSDHNATPIKLSWEKAGILFQYFVPRQVPEFDSYKIKSVSSDVENLLRRIYSLVPDDLSPAHYLPSVTDYIGGNSEAPCPSPFIINSLKDPYKICHQLYYLLGDFYFKNKEPSKAVKFYQLDLVINSNRLDSWAGLALAKKYQIEQKLNSTELKIESTVYKKSEAALRCFRRALELQKGSRKLWLEYGSLAYQLHSHDSRQIRLKELLSVNSEITENSKNQQKESLLLAKQNYIQARECQGDDTEEDWLTHYMLGKIAEKEQNSPVIYLEHYKQAAICLYNEKASYPKKIQFASIPPPFTLEALEVFYRLHVSALKLVLYNSSDEHLQLILTYIQDSLLSPFAKCEEKNMTVNQEREEICISANLALTQAVQKHICHKNPLDHDYSIHNNVNDSQFDKTNSVQYEETPTTSKILHDLNVENTETERTKNLDYSSKSVNSFIASYVPQTPAIHSHVQRQFHDFYKENDLQFQAEKYTANRFSTNTDDLCDENVNNTLTDSCGLNLIRNIETTLNFLDASGDIDKRVSFLPSQQPDEVLSAQTLRCDLIDNKIQNNSTHQQLQSKSSINDEDLYCMNDAGDMTAVNIKVTEKVIIDKSVGMITPETLETMKIGKKQCQAQFSLTSSILNIPALKEVTSHNIKANKEAQLDDLCGNGDLIENQKLIPFEKLNLKKSNETDYEGKKPIFLKTEIITKCVRALELCAERYSAHYKSLYRLAEIYYVSKNLNKARDILLGRPDWQDKHHMPAPGLFAERKQSNFFQGLWKIPLEDIDRPGCFATHVHRSVVLLLKVLTDLGDIEMLKTLRGQLKRTPDAGKKYLRDAERLALAEMAFSKCVEVVNRKMDTCDKWSERQREDNLANVYQVWLMGKGSNCFKESTSALHRAFKIMMKGRTDVNRLTEDQAIMYCHSNLSKVTPSPVSSALQSRQVIDKNRLILSTSSAVMMGKDNATKVQEKEQEIIQNTDAAKKIAEDVRNAAMNYLQESSTNIKSDNMPTNTDNLTEFYQFTSLKKTSIIKSQITDILCPMTLDVEKSCYSKGSTDSQNIVIYEPEDNVDRASKTEACFSALSLSKGLEDEDVIIISESD